MKAPNELSHNAQKLMFLLAFKEDMMDLEHALKVVCGFTDECVDAAIQECVAAGYIQNSQRDVPQQQG